MTFSGTTALHVAVGRQLVQMAVLLMAAGADPYKESNELIEVDDLDCEDDERDYVRPIDMAQGNIEVWYAELVWRHFVLTILQSSEAWEQIWISPDERLNSSAWFFYVISALSDMCRMKSAFWLWCIGTYL